MNRSWIARSSAAVALVAGSLLLAACGASASPGSSSTAATSSPAASGSSPVAKGPIVVGAFGFGESKILANMYADVLTKAGYEASVKELTNREVVEPALEKGDVQVVPEYLATLTEFLNAKVNGANPAPKASGDVDKTLAALKALAEPRGLTPLTPSPAADQNAFAVTSDFASANNLTSLSDLAAYSQSHDVRLGGPPECPTRTYCQIGLEKTYGMKISSFTSLDAGGPLTKQALKQGKIDVGLVFSSDGGVAAFNLVVLTDDKKLQNADNVIPVVNSSVMSDDLAAALNAVSAALTTDDLVALNKSVDIDRKDPATVAKDWLTSKGLV
ncbi:MAG: amino acid ABC transporter substrate-binding protein [Frankiales bacterium]|nr:amino acid ABC transporter substrate-binding protein [Frankiales bacterium]